MFGTKKFLSSWQFSYLLFLVPETTKSSFRKIKCFERWPCFAFSKQLPCPFRRTHHDNNNNNSYFVLFLDSERSWHRRRRCCADPDPESAREPEKRESRRPEVESSDPAADAADDRRPVRRRRRQNTGHIQRLTRWQSFWGICFLGLKKISGASFTQSHPKLRFYP